MEISLLRQKNSSGAKHSLPVEVSWCKTQDLPVILTCVVLMNCASSFEAELISEWCGIRLLWFLSTGLEREVNSPSLKLAILFLKAAEVQTAGFPYEFGVKHGI